MFDVVIAAVVFAPLQKRRQLEEGEALESVDMGTESMDVAVTEDESFEPPRDLLMIEELEGSDDEDSDEDSDDEDSDDEDEDDEKEVSVMHRYRQRH